MSEAARAVVVEDEDAVRDAVVRALVREGLVVSGFADYAEVDLVLGAAPDLVVLDIGLPGGDGFELARRLRASRDLPIVFLTARDAVEDRIAGFDLGADDYLVKPFAIPELLARIRALLRRGRTDQVLKLQHEDLEMDLVTRKVARAGQAIELTVKEFEILEYLLRHVGRVVSREMLTRDVWHVAARATPLDNVIDVSIARLRRKIDDAFPVKLLQTVRGVGFVLRRERG